MLRPKPTPKSRGDRLKPGTSWEDAALKLLSTPAKSAPPRPAKTFKKRPK